MTSSGRTSKTRSVVGYLIAIIYISVIVGIGFLLDRCGRNLSQEHRVHAVKDMQQLNTTVSDGTFFNNLSSKYNANSGPMFGKCQVHQPVQGKWEISITETQIDYMGLITVANRDLGEAGRRQSAVILAYVLKLIGTRIDKVSKIAVNLSEIDSYGARVEYKTEVSVDQGVVGLVEVTHDTATGKILSVKSKR